MVYRVSELAANLQETIQSVYGRSTYWVIGEVSSSTHYPDKDRYYFDLVEKIPGASETARLKVNAWQAGAARIRNFTTTTGQVLQDGIQVMIQVNINFHIVYGLSLTLTDINAEFTMGNLALQRQETLARLVRENPESVALIDGKYQTANKQAHLARVIQRVAVIGSPNSEGFRDFTTVLRNNSSGFTFTLDTYYSSVQGKAAESELVKALIDVFKQSLLAPYDVVVMIRGGGSKTDFLVFDSYPVARAAARFPVPILTGIGHTGDHSITDKMVYESLNTPTKVAEFILEHNRRFDESISRFSATIQTCASDRIHTIGNQLTKVIQKVNYGTRRRLTKDTTNMQQLSWQVTSQVKWQLRSAREKLNTYRTTLAQESSTQIESQRQKVEEIPIAQPLKQVFRQQQQQLETIGLILKMNDPQRVLERGYTLIYSKSKVVKNPDEIEPGQDLRIRFSTREIAVKATADG